MDYQEDAWLDGVLGQYQGQRIQLPQGDLVLGRSRICDVQISSSGVSRQHAKIRYAQGNYYLQDQYSAMGTKVNDQDVQATVLHNGDMITIGDSTFRFQRDTQEKVIVEEPLVNAQSGSSYSWWKRWGGLVTIGGLLLIAVLGWGVKEGVERDLFTNDTEKPAIIGTLEPWTPETPIAGRYLALCEYMDDQQSCTVTETIITSDPQGKFEVFGMPAGKYMIIYDSGLEDFDKAMKEWGGTELRFFDSDWLDEYFGMYGGTEGWEKIHIPKGVDIDPSKMTAYGEFSLLLGNSPFVLAHAIGKQFDNDQIILEPVIVNVVEGQTSNVVVPVVYHGE